MPLSTAPVLGSRVPRSGLRRAGDFVLYAIIGILFVSGAAWYGFHQARSGGSPNLPMKWIGFGGMTALVFGYLIHNNAKRWRVARFWLLLTAALITHVAVGTAALANIKTVPLLLWGPIGAMEFGALALFLAAFTHPSAK
jgi:hypothetical protein